MPDDAPMTKSRRSRKPGRARGQRTPRPDTAPRLPLPFLQGVEELDRMLHAAEGRATGGVSPAGVVSAYMDWLAHIANSPTKLTTLAAKAMTDWSRLAGFALASPHDAEAPKAAREDRRDPRFRAGEWNAWPFNVMAQSFLVTQSWWREATRDVRGMTRQHQREVQFVTRQMLDAMSPSNFAWSNPEVLHRTVEEGGKNLMRGMANLVGDWRRALDGEKVKALEEFEVGRNLAVTPGKVIFRNHLMELIQYAPTTESVWREPVLIVPAWIMKYYVLDLSAHNSLVRYLVSRGHTVFMISWNNPTADDRGMGLDDYRRLGLMAALDVVENVLPGRKVHACGYCLGGTLLAIAASAMARDGDDRLASITLLAAQTDFTEAGELMLFIDESELSFLEDMTATRGYLDTKEMAGAFQLLRANDLIWSRMVREYLMGEEAPAIDLMAWNADQTRLPARMHSEYLRELFLENRLATGKYEVDGRPISLTDIDAEIFAVGTIRDHIAPWESVFKIKILSDTDVTFVLAAGGHNAGIVSEPGHPGRSYQLMILKESGSYQDPDAWRRAAPSRKGSWWPAWSDWLAERSTTREKPPRMGTPRRGIRPLADAPGDYVRHA